MEQIAIVGPSGCRQNNACQKLSSILKIKAFHLDRLFWQPNWEKN